MSNTMGLWNYLHQFKELAICVKNGRFISVRVYDAEKLLTLVRKYGLSGAFGDVLEKCTGEGYKVRRCKDYKNFCTVEGETSRMRDALKAYYHTKVLYPVGLPTMEKAHIMEKAVAQARGARWTGTDSAEKRGDYIPDYIMQNGDAGEVKSAEHGRIF